MEEHIEFIKEQYHNLRENSLKPFYFVNDLRRKYIEYKRGMLLVHIKISLSYEADKLYCNKLVWEFPKSAFNYRILAIDVDYRLFIQNEYYYLTRSFNFYREKPAANQHRYIYNYYKTRIALIENEMKWLEQNE